MQLMQKKKTVVKHYMPKQLPRLLQCMCFLCDMHKMKT